MAYMSQERKKQIKVELDKILKGKGFKYSVGVDNHSTLVLNIYSGPIDFINNYNSSERNTARFLSNPDDRCLARTYMQPNPYWYKEHFTGEAKELLIKLFTAMDEGNHDHSDSQSDYFDVGWYKEINIGKWDRPYQFTNDWTLKSGAA